jgi:hypothetical protein
MKSTKIGKTDFNCTFQKEIEGGGRRWLYIALVSVVDWLGAPYTDKDVLAALESAPYIKEYCRSHESGIFGLSPLAILLVVFEISPSAPMELKIRAVRLLYEYWRRRETSGKGLFR